MQQTESTPTHGTPLLADYYTINQLAAELGITRRTLELWHAQRIGPPRTMIGRRPYYYRQAVIGWLQSQQQEMPNRAA